MSDEDGHDGIYTWVQIDVCTHSMKCVGYCYIGPFDSFNAACDYNKAMLQQLAAHWPATEREAPQAGNRAGNGATLFVRVSGLCVYRPGTPSYQALELEPEKVVSPNETPSSLMQRMPALIYRQVTTDLVGMLPGMTDDESSLTTAV